MLLKFKNFDIPKNKVKQVNDFFNKYQCHDNKLKLKEKNISFCKLLIFLLEYSILILLYL